MIYKENLFLKVAELLFIIFYLVMWLHAWLRKPRIKKNVLLLHEAYFQ